LVGWSIDGSGDTMTRPSHGPRYFRRRCPTIGGRRPGRLRAVRVRTFELRLIGLAIAGCWVVAAGLVLVGYRPGGPIDVAVGVAALLPAVVALAGIAWPPVARGDRAFAVMVILAAGSLLVLVPSIADITGQLGGGGVQTLLPSVEAAYPWVLGLIGTCLFSGFGIARRRLGEAAMRRRRLVRGLVLATVLTAATSWPCATGSRRRRASGRPTLIANRRPAPARWGSVRRRDWPSTWTA